MKEEFAAPAEPSRTEEKNSRPVAAIVPKTKPEVKPFVSLERDLELSSDLPESKSEELPLVIDAGRPDWSDVEPDSDHESTLTTTRHRSKVELPPPPVYTEPDRPILIEDEPPAPPESVTETESTDVVTPIEPMPAALSPLTEDPSVRRPTRPAKPYAPAAKKAKATLAAIPIAPPRPPADISDSRHRTRIVPRAIVAEMALDFSKSISLLVAELTEQYQLNTAEQKRCRKTLKAVRVGHKQLARHFRDHFGFKCRDEETRGRFLDWLEDECQAIAALDLEPDSDD